jgi:hypothetical protein
MDPDTRTRAAIEEHWQASERGDTETEHAIYATGAILDYRNPVNGSGAARRSWRNAAGTRPAGTSRSSGSPAAGTCG